MAGFLFSVCFIRQSVFPSFSSSSFDYLPIVHKVCERCVAKTRYCCCTLLVVCGVYFVGSVDIIWLLFGLHSMELIRWSTFSQSHTLPRLVRNHSNDADACVQDRFRLPTKGWVHQQCFLFLFFFFFFCVLWHHLNLMRIGKNWFKFILRPPRNFSHSLRVAMESDMESLNSVHYLIIIIIIICDGRGNDHFHFHFFFFICKFLGKAAEKCMRR